MSATSKKSSKKTGNKANDRPFAPAILKQAKEQASRYRLILQEEEGGYGATVFEMPNVYGFGETVEKCHKETRELLISMLAFMLERGEQPPAPLGEEKRTAQINLRVTPSEKFRLEETARQKGFRGVSDYIRSTAIDKMYQ